MMAANAEGNRCGHWRIKTSLEKAKFPIDHKADAARLNKARRFGQRRGADIVARSFAGSLW